MASFERAVSLSLVSGNALVIIALQIIAALRVKVASFSKPSYFFANTIDTPETRLTAPEEAACFSFLSKRFSAYIVTAFKSTFTIFISFTFLA